VNNFSALILACATTLSAAATADTLNGTQRYYEVRGAKLYTQIYGHGSPIVLLHGGMMFFDNSFAKQRDYFSSCATVIGIDQRGHGHSPDGPWPLSYKMMADDTAAILEQLGVGRVDVVGHSDGADLALLLARDHPNLVRRLVVSGTNIRGIWSKLPAAELRRRSEWSDEQFALQVRSVANFLPPWAQPDYAKVNPDGPEHWTELLAKTYKMWIQPIVIEPEDLKKIAIPVLVMAGDHDLASLEDTAEIFHDLPNGQLLIVPASNHGTFKARPDLVNLAIREFLNLSDCKQPAQQ
jgi:pimeloyl-ACP methyl ester carboxylesterase